MTRLNNLRNDKKEKDAALALDQKPTSTNPMSRELESELNSHVTDILILQYTQSCSYQVCRSSAGSFLVKHKPYAVHPAAPTWHDVDAFTQYMVPRYCRTRVVKVIEFQEHSHLECSCGLFQRCGYPCRHIYSVLDRPPTPSDVILRYHKTFRYHYHRGRVEVDQKFDAILDNEPPGPIFTGSEMVVNPSWEVEPFWTFTLPDKPPQVEISSRWAPVTSESMPRHESSSVLERQSQEVGMSQATAAEFDQNDDVDTPDFPFDDLELLPFHNKAHASDNSDGAKSNQSPQQNQKASSTAHRAKQNCYSFLQPYFQEMAKLGEVNAEMYDEMKQLVVEATESLRKKAAGMMVRKGQAVIDPNNDTDPNNGIGGFCSDTGSLGGIVSSSLELERRHKSVRKRPFHSPHRKARKR